MQASIVVKMLLRCKCSSSSFSRGNCGLEQATYGRSIVPCIAQKSRQARAPPLQYQPEHGAVKSQAGEAAQQVSSRQYKSALQGQGHAADPHGSEDAVRVVGLGQRGISAAARLMSNESLQSADFWMLDTDAKVLSSSKGPNCIQLPMEDDAQLSHEQLERMAGKAARPEMSTADGRPGLNFPITSSGVAYLLGAAGGIPGGSKLVLQLASHLRRAGYFVLAALTLPFDFEGRRKVEEASALVEALQDVANLVVVVPQGVLVRASAELTVTQALEIADMTLETSCRTIQWALNVPEVLLASAGSMLWHGRDLRQYRRLLSPPMELLGTCPGAGHVGRGFASMPVQHLSEAGLASGLSTLAETAVVAAADSPFLDNLLASASGVLCVLSLPERVMSHNLDMSPGALDDPEKYAIRAAVQVAASMVTDLAGAHCDKVVACAYIRPDWPHKDPSELCMEATLLVVEDPAAAEEKEDLGSTGTSKVTPSASSSAATAAARFGGRLSSGPILHPALIKQPQQQQQQQQQQQRQQSSERQQPPAQERQAPSRQQQQQQQPPVQPVQQPAPRPAQSWTRSKTWQQTRGSPKERLPYAPASAALASSPAAPAAKQHQVGRPAGTNSQPPAAVSPAAPTQPPQGVDVQADHGLQLLPRLADKFVDTMVAQSLDLPPSAARWRQHQRKQNDKQAARRASGHFPVAAIPWASTNKPTGQAAEAASVDDIVAGAQVVWEEDVLSTPRDVKSRVAGMLQKERLGVDNSWEEEEDN